MSAAITQHPIPIGPGNDPSHPIPHLGVLDVACYLAGGGARLTVVVASPLDGSEHSQTRLLDKLESYLRFVGSAEFIQHAAGPPTPGNTSIEVLLHPDTSGEIRALLLRCEQWVQAGNASLVVRDLTAAELGST